MKKLLVLVFAFCLTGVASAARYSCDLDGSMKGLGVSFVWGGQVLKGTGTIVCNNLYSGSKSSMPVELALISAGWGFDATWTQALFIQSRGIFLDSRVPHDLLGEYSVGATAGATLINSGIDFDTAIRLSKDPSITFEAALTGRDAVGLGVRLQGVVLRISEVD